MHVARREREVEEVVGHVLRLAHHLDQSAARELACHDLTPAQLHLLVAVRARPGGLQQEAGEQLGVTKGNVSMLVTRLQDKGLLTRTAVGGGNELRLTPDGEHLLRRLLPDRRRWAAQLFAVLPEEDLLALLRALRIVGATLP